MADSADRPISDKSTTLAWYPGASLQAPLPGSRGSRRITFWASVDLSRFVDGICRME
jgi:hypothetical protein